MKFYSGENRLRAMGDSMTCCGIDGLEGFKGNYGWARTITRCTRLESVPAIFSRSS